MLTGLGLWTALPLWTGPAAASPVPMMGRRRGAEQPALDRWKRARSVHRRGDHRGRRADAEGLAPAKPPSWKDARLLVGVLLVLAATVLGSLAVAAADDRVPMYAASGPLVPGQPRSAASTVDVQLGGQRPAGTSRRCRRCRGPTCCEGRPGELVPLSAIGAGDDVQVQPLTLTVDANSPRRSSWGRSSTSTSTRSRRTATPPARLRRRGLALIGIGGGLPGRGRLAAPLDQAVQVMAPKDQIRDLIGQVDLGARVTLVPVPGSRLRNDS